MKDFITVEEARSAILAAIEPVDSERILLTQADDRVLAEPIVAPEDSPPFDNSAMDGYAVRWDDLDAEGATTLEIVGEVAAGDAPLRAVGPNEAMRIMTGAPVPDGADTVVVRESCEETDRTVVVRERPGKGQGANIRFGGENMAEGESVLEAGDRVGPAEVGLIASFRQAALSVYRQPVVAILTTGDELVDIDQPREPSKIVNSNAYMMRGLVAASGARPVVFPVVPDEAAATRDAFERALRSADVVVSVGGVSVGDYDFVTDILNELTDGMNFWKIRMKPGKPLAFGVADGTPLIGLPGNPVSSFVCFHQFVRPALAVAQGMAPADALLRRVRAEITDDIRSTPKRRHYVTGNLLADGDRNRFVPYPNQSSGNLRAICQCSAFALVDEGIAHLPAGAELVVELL